MQTEIKNNSLVVHAWTVAKCEGDFFLPLPQLIYLSEIKKYYEKIILLSVVRIIEEKENKLVPLSSISKIEVFELPFSEGYIGAVKFFPYYVMAYYKLRHYKVVYSRYPVPFGWLQKLFFKERILHFVGDPIGTIENNPNINKFKKMLLINLFKPEHEMFIWACRGARVFTNGYHIADKIRKKNLSVTPLISSTLTQNDFFFDEDKRRFPDKIKFLYVGYLRKAKGVQTIIDAFRLVQKKVPDASLTIVGSGEEEFSLKEYTKNLKNVNFLGEISDRKYLLNVLRSHDIFLFGSFSEGSPRVVLEAMANGLNVVSTPVGSLPATFQHDVDISFAEIDNPVKFANEMMKLITSNEYAFRIRKRAFERSQEFTISNFLKNIFG